MLIKAVTAEQAIVLISLLALVVSVATVVISIRKDERNNRTSGRIRARTYGYEPYSFLKPWVSAYIYGNLGRYRRLNKRAFLSEVKRVEHLVIKGLNTFKKYSKAFKVKK